MSRIKFFITAPFNVLYKYHVEGEGDERKAATEKEEEGREIEKCIKLLFLTKTDNCQFLVNW